MDFSLKSFADAFRDVQYRIAHESFLAFSFILATPADKKVFPDLLLHLYDVDRLTGETILVVAPRIWMGRLMSESASVNVGKISQVFSEVLSTKDYYGIDVSEEVEKFLKAQTKESYAFARFIGLRIDEIPCIVFFETLECPEKYICWSLIDDSVTDVIQDFRKIVAAIEHARTKQIKRSSLEIINGLNRKRFAFKVLSGLGKVVPLLTNYLSSIK